MQSDNAIEVVETAILSNSLFAKFTSWSSNSSDGKIKVADGEWQRAAARLGGGQSHENRLLAARRQNEIIEII